MKKGERFTDSQKRKPSTNEKLQASLPFTNLWKAV